MAVEDFDRIAALNLRGMVLAMQAEIPAMLKSGGGAIVNVSSTAGLVGVPGMSLYAATKWGVIGLTKSVALEYVTRGIRINAIARGLTATEMLDGAAKEEREFLLSITPMKRISRPVEIARSVIYLLARCVLLRTRAFSYLMRLVIWETTFLACIPAKALT
jgi:NAD(P)-dependent dehydrogenase (short-subunit alcohol dehydrogenase family)